MSDSNEVLGRLNVAPDQHAGILADFANVWHTDQYFVIDFASQVSAPHPELVEGEQRTVVDSTVVSRVKVLPDQILPLIQALQNQSDHWISRHNHFGSPDEIINPH